MMSSARQDEVGVLAKAFAEMTESLGQMTRVAAQISKGDLTVEVIPKSDKDILGKSLLIHAGESPARYQGDPGIDQRPLLIGPGDSSRPPRKWLLRRLRLQQQFPKRQPRSRK